MYHTCYMFMVNEQNRLCCLSGISYCMSSHVLQHLKLVRNRQERSSRSQNTFLKLCVFQAIYTTLYFLLSLLSCQVSLLCLIMFRNYLSACIDKSARQCIRQLCHSSVIIMSELLFKEYRFKSCDADDKKKTKNNLICIKLNFATEKFLHMSDNHRSWMWGCGPQWFVVIHWLGK